jgi:hypothetical protein
MTPRLGTAALCWLGLLASADVSRAQRTGTWEYRELETDSAITLQNEMQELGSHGFRFRAVMNNDRPKRLRRSEVMVIMVRDGSRPRGNYGYRVLATSGTAAIRKEFVAASNVGFRYVGEVVNALQWLPADTKEPWRAPVIIFEQNRKAPTTRYEYSLIETGDIPAMEKALREAGDAGFDRRSIIHDATSRRNEAVLILERQRQAARVRYEYQVRSTTGPSLMDDMATGRDRGYGVDMLPAVEGTPGVDWILVLRRKVEPTPRKARSAK